MGRTSLYHHFDNAGRLLYVGISLSHIQRLAQHRGKAHWYWDIASIKVAHYPGRTRPACESRARARSE